MTRREGSFHFTSESVSQGHPDKVSDQISDAILDSLLKDNINSSQILGALAYKISSLRARRSLPFSEEVLSNLQKTDSDIKSGRFTPRLALELLVVRLQKLF